jgi:signal transduction histidine kinase
MALIMLPVSPTRAARREEPPQVPGVNAQPTVLILAPEDFTRPYVRFIFEGFSDVAHAEPGSPAVYFESLDASRFQQRQYREDLREWLRRRYRDTRIDIVVALAEDALGFLADAHGEPWPGARVLYAEVGSVSVDTRSALPQAGGMLLEDHFLDALGVIKTILPATKRVALVYGASAIELTRFRDYREKVRTAGLEPIELAGMSIEGTLEAVARLPAQTAVIILAPSLDANGRVLSPDQTCRLISAAASAPSFTLAAHDLGCGVVGGLMRDWTIVGRVLARQVLRRLAHPSADVVSVPVAEYTTLAFDARRLERWRIPEPRLPPGAVVRFLEPNVWRDHRALVITVIGVTLVQSLLIAGLIFEYKRRRRAEIDSRRNLVALAHMDRRAAMGELATSLAHELNQPLNAILQNAGVVQMLLTSNTVPPALGELPEIISDIRRDDIRASEMIRRMRRLLQKHELEFNPVDLNEVAQDTVAIVRHDAKSREIELEMELADGLRPILGDRVHLQQVLLNVLMNAVDAVDTMPPERRRVRVCTTQSDGEVRLAVADTGMGIRADRIPEIFEPFYTTKREGDGMGMGLAIAHSIVEAHAGRMAAENNPEGGATVWFSVPMSPRPQS